MPVSSVSLQGISQRRNFSSKTSSVWGDVLLMMETETWGGEGCRGQTWHDGGDDVLAISASRHLSLTAWAPVPCLLRVGSPLWGTPWLHWPGQLLEGCAGPDRVGSQESDAWGGAEGGRWGRKCARGSCALIWCWGWRRADVEGSRGRTGRGKSTPHWINWKWERENMHKKYWDLVIQLQNRSPAVIHLSFYQHWP